MAKKSSRAKPNRSKSAASTPGVAAVTVLLLICAVSVVSVATWQRYSFAENGLFPLWQVALGAGLFCGVLFVGIFVAKEHGVGKRIGVFFLISALCFFAAGTVLAHLNHLFDHSQPVRYTVVIEDKESRHSRRSRHHEFTVTARGDTFDIEVPYRHYNAYEVGDRYVIEYREGALGEPYYIAVGGVSEDTEAP